MPEWAIVEIPFSITVPITLRMSVYKFTFNNCSTLCIPFLISFLGGLLKRCKLHHCRIFLTCLGTKCDEAEILHILVAENVCNLYLCCRWTHIHQTDPWRGQYPPGFWSWCKPSRRGEGTSWVDKSTTVSITTWDSAAMRLRQRSVFLSDHLVSLEKNSR